MRRRRRGCHEGACGLLVACGDRTVSLLRSQTLQPGPQPLNLVAVRVDPGRTDRTTFPHSDGSGLPNVRPGSRCARGRRGCCSPGRQPPTAARRAACSAAGWREAARGPGPVPAQRRQPGRWRRRSHKAWCQSRPETDPAPHACPVVRTSSFEVRPPPSGERRMLVLSRNVMPSSTRHRRSESGRRRSSLEGPEDGS